MTTTTYGRAGAPVVAVHDGTITGIGTTSGLGKFVRLRDAYGNTYTYSQLAELSSFYAVPKPQSEAARPSAGEAHRGSEAGTRPAAPLRGRPRRGRRSAARRGPAESCRVCAALLSMTALIAAPCGSGLVSCTPHLNSTRGSTHL